MNTYCGVNCENCPSKENCKGCVATCGSPFGGRCVAAEYCKAGGLEAYRQFKQKLTEEVNALLAAEGLGAVDDLVELVGAYVNLAYPMPSGDRSSDVCSSDLFELAGAYVNLAYPTPGGETVKLLNDKNIYLGAQIEFADLGVCYGVIADTGFILLCSYSKDGLEPELLVYRKR